MNHDEDDEAMSPVSLKAAAQSELHQKNSRPPEAVNNKDKLSE